ncbi:hypothetical protein, partial [Actinobacillus pleuropneumoniae]|uniref:hypothetical protein n=1 Tax=Actinobacillus pleuropneumoniae TaxID=715 RepID=UPI00227A41CD
SKTVLNTKSVDTGITPFFFLGKFSTCFKNGGENHFLAQKLSKKHPKKRIVLILEEHFFFKSKISTFRNNGIKYFIMTLKNIKFK